MAGATLERDVGQNCTKMYQENLKMLRLFSERMSKV